MVLVDNPFDILLYLGKAFIVKAGNLVEHHRIKGALHGYFALGIEHLYVQESFQYMNAFLRKEKQQKNADEELENIAAVKKQLTHGKA